MLTGSNKTDYTDIQANVRELVEYLNNHGHITTDSGDGKINVDAGMEGAMAYLHVVVKSTPDRVIKESNEIKFLLGLKHVWMDYFIQANYSPDDAIATIIIIDIDSKQNYM